MRRIGRWAGAAGVVLVLVAAAAGASAQQAWVRDEVRLNVRTGRGTQYRIVGVVKTGDQVDILDRSDDWTQVRTPDGEAGWIPAGFLQAEPPAVVRVDRLESRVTELSSNLESLRAEAEQLRSENQTLAARDEEQVQQIEKLTAENRDLRAGQRWPYLLTGAGILVAGLILGAILQSISGRRQTRRIRL